MILLFILLLFKFFFLTSFLTSAVWIYIRLSSNPFPKQVLAIKTWLQEIAQKIEPTQEKLSKKFKEISEKINYYRKWIGNIMIILPLIAILFWYFSYSTNSNKITEEKISKYTKNTEKTIQKDKKSPYALVSKNEITKIPDWETITRGDFVKMLTIYKNEKISKTNNTTCFSDLKNTKNAPYICHAVEKWWLDGVSYNWFSPNSLTTKAQALKIIFNFYEIPVTKNIQKTSFDDVYLTDWFAPYIEHAVSLWIIEDMTWEKFFPKSPITLKTLDTYISKIEKVK